MSEKHCIRDRKMQETKNTANEQYVYPLMREYWKSSSKQLIKRTRAPACVRLRKRTNSRNSAKKPNLIMWANRSSKFLGLQTWPHIEEKFNFCIWHIVKSKPYRLFELIPVIIAAMAASVDEINDTCKFRRFWLH